MKPYTKDESKKIQVRRIFNNIAPYYDKICHILSFNIDKLWRKRLIKLVAERELTIGTGDVSISMAKNIPNTQIVGIDLLEEILKVAQHKIECLGVKSNIVLLCENAEHLSPPSNSFDIVIISFGIRNFENINNSFGNCTVISLSNGIAHIYIGVKSQIYTV